jgi:hypothetical protein
MPKEEQNYWYSLKSGAKTKKKNQKDTADVEALEDEIARLRKRVQELEGTEAPKGIPQVVVAKTSDK